MTNQATVDVSPPDEATPDAAPASLATGDTLTVGRTLKIGLFHLGSGMADVVATGVWNRIMITDLGFSATPVGLLLALRYFLAPLGIWAGQQSDRRAIAGYRRLPWVWGGRGLMAMSVALLGIVTASIAATYTEANGASADAFTWGALAFSLLLFSLGNAISSSTFLALIYDRSAPDHRGRNIGIVWTYLLVGFTIGGVLFGLLLPHEEGALGFTPESLRNLFVVGALVMIFIWVAALVGEEKRVRDTRASAAPTTEEGYEHRTNLLDDLRTAWRSRPLRYFFWYLVLSMLFAFSQDPILEPFAGTVFEMSAAVTTRFTAYWGTTAIIATIAFLFLGRRYKSLTNERMNLYGVSVLLVTFVLFAVSSLFEIRQLVTPGLITLGIGLGMWNVGTLGMMMDMSPNGRAGAFLGFWTLVVTLSRGLGVSSGGPVRDVVLAISGSENLAYGMVFVVGAIGLGVALYMLRQVRVKEFQQSFTTETTGAPAKAEQVFAASLD